MAPLPALNIQCLGVQAYAPIWEQMQLYTKERGPQSEDQIWLLQHPAMYTLGQRETQHLLPTNSSLPWIHSDRGGEITYHGPGQLVAYLLLDLRRRGWNVRHLVHQIEQLLIDFLALYQIDAHRRPKMPGIYVNNAKIASLGLRVRGGCSYHGLSLNVNMDLSPFRAISPCGFSDLEVTHMAEFSPEIQLEDLIQPFIIQVEKQFRQK